MLLAVISSISACIGGGGDDVQNVNAGPSPTVTDITATPPLSFNDLASFSVTGANLGAGIGVTEIGCGGAAISSGGTESSRTLTCTPNRDGEITITIANSAGSTLITKTFSVPKPQVKITTSLGDVLIELEPAKAPNTVKNFLTYVSENFYVNTVFHRIIHTFMAQGGGATFNGSNYLAKAPTHSAIALERTSTTGLSNTATTIAMARTSAADSATSQFFINFVENLFLNAQNQSDGNGYSVFGTVITTVDVNSNATLDAMKAVAVVSNGSEVSLPVIPPVIISTVRLQ